MRKLIITIIIIIINKLNIKFSFLLNISLFLN